MYSSKFNEGVGFVKTIRMSGCFHDDADIKAVPIQLADLLPKQRPVSARCVTTIRARTFHSSYCPTVLTSCFGCRTRGNNKICNVVSSFTTQ